jgi:hypothetical protein
LTQKPKLYNYKHEEFYLLGYNAVQSVESQTTFLRNISPPASRLKRKPRKKPVWGRQQVKLELFITTAVRTSDPTQLRV